MDIRKILFALFFIALFITQSAGAVVLFEEDFSDNSAGWTLGTDWEIGPAVLGPTGGGGTSGSHDPEFDHTPTADNGLAGVIIGGNTSNTLHPFYYLTSPVINTAGAGDLTLEFYRWLASDYTPYIQNAIEVFDGTVWNTIWLSGPSPAIVDTSWLLQTFDISSYANASMQVRFGYNVASSGNWSVPSWSLDDISIFSAESTVPVPAPLALLGLGILGLAWNQRRKA
ncbi:MAG: PEP-CTERM sorting domain-containing protein [Chromatiales bacterium]|jgi:hypothetical protein